MLYINLLFQRLVTSGKIKQHRYNTEYSINKFCNQRHWNMKIKRSKLRCVLQMGYKSSKLCSCGFPYSLAFIFISCRCKPTVVKLSTQHTLHPTRNYIPRISSNIHHIEKYVVMRSVFVSCKSFLR